MTPKMTPRRLKRILRGKISEYISKNKSISQRPMSVLLLIVASLLTFSGFATVQNMYVIHDNGNTSIYYSFSTNVDEIIHSANVRLGPNDMVSYSFGEGGNDILILRASDVSVIDGGNTYSLVCHGETVGCVLDSLGITLDENDYISAPVLSVASGEITVSRSYTGIIEITEIIPYETVYSASNSLDGTPPVLLRAGETGEMINYYLVSYTGSGQEFSRSYICSEIIKEPVDEIISVDESELNATLSNDNFGSKFIVEQNSDGSGTITMLTGETYEFSSTDTFQCTAYSNEGRAWRTTYTGTTVKVGVVAVDPSIIPLGTTLFIATPDGEYVYGLCVAEDTGSAVSGKIIDLYFDTYSECWQFGRRDCIVYYIN